MKTASRLALRLLPLLLAACGGDDGASSTGSTSTTAGGSAGAPGGAGGQGGSGQGGAAGQTGGAGQGGSGGSGQAGTGQAGTGQAGAGQGGAGQAGSAGQGGAALVCDDTPVLPGEDTGFLVCKGSTVHRAEIKACPDKLTAEGGECGFGGPTPGPGFCAKNGDCKDAPFGYCGLSDGGAAACLCRYGCTDDSQCQPGQICQCGASIGKCVASSCKSDADCGAGSLCLSHGTDSGCGSGVAFACSTPQDQCLQDSDCPPGVGSPGGIKVCGHDGSKRVCIDVFACAGRPLQIDAGPRVASLSRLAWG